MIRIEYTKVADAAMVHLSRVFMLWIFSSKPESHFHQAFPAKADPINMHVMIFTPPKSHEKTRELHSADVAFGRMDKAPRFGVNKLKQPVSQLHFFTSI
jgi:hypothetical protein